MIGGRFINAFTLVELIVVITIIGILSTIGFVSYSGYLTGARDSNRISQLLKVTDSLQVYSVNKSLPLPDNSITITASGSNDIIGYQGYLGADVLEAIDYSNGGKDPKDGTYYTYYLTKDRKNMQLLALWNDQIYLQKYEILKNIAQIQTTFAVDYEERFPKTFGKNLGVLTSNESATLNTPAQEIPLNMSNGYLDIFHTPNRYTANYGSNGTFSGTGVLFGMQMIGGGKLVGKWSFDEGTGNTALDTSGNNINGSFSGVTFPGYVLGVRGTGLDFLGNLTSNAQGSSIIFSDNLDNLDTPFFTFAFWMKPDNQSNATTAKHAIIVKNLSSNSNEAIFEFSWGHMNILHQQSCLITTTNGWEAVQIKGVLDISQWNHIACVYSDEYLSIYVNGIKNNSIKTSSGILRGKSSMAFGGGGQINSNNLGKVHYYDGKLDEFYLFKKAMSDSEINLLYLNSQ